jgi:hypothetical protein
MRVLIVVVLALVALASAGVWALAQFGDSFTGGAQHAGTPMIREPEIVVADTPVKPASPNTNLSMRSQPATPQATPAPAVKTDVTPPSTPATPADPLAAPVPAPANPPLLPQSFDDPNARKSLAPSAPAAPPGTVQPQSAPSPPPAAAQAKTADAIVKPQSAPAPAKPAAQAASGVTASLEAQFKSRKVTYNRPPTKLALSKPIDVSLVINATSDENAGKDALQGFPGTVVERDVDLSDTVSAQLTGLGFDITSQTVVRQKLSGKTVNRWQWRVTPTETGTRTLLLEIFGYATGSLDAEPLDAYKDQIVVEVQQLDQVIIWAKGVQPVFAILAALAGATSALFGMLRFREERKKNKPAA